MHLTGDLKKFEKQNKLVDAVLSTLGSSFREFDRKQPIDHIFIPEDTMKVDNVLYDTKKYNGINPSDHYIAIAEVSRKK